ncbi:fungal-specific transcription factor domain-containing protein [Cadophora sp. MPI-SDFR-AT-0126]|nr:fungal-specific transcription factor domain-containing protein [Leotiomycetes sp. MPI-SDFR-AT-0126]
MPERVPAPFTTVFRASETQNQRNKRNRPTVSCTACQKRKLRCDRRRPCGACEKRGHHAACIFSPSGCDEDRSSGGGTKEEVLSRLAKLEEMMKGLAESPRRNGREDLCDPGDTDANKCANAMPYIADADDTTSDFHPPPISPGHDVIFGDLAPVSIGDIVSCMPPRMEVERLINACFGSQLVAIPFLHEHHFRRQYEALWEAPSSSNILWISILFSVLSIGAAISQTKEGSIAPTSMIVSEPQVYSNMAARCLVSGRYTQAKIYSVEAILAHICSRRIWTHNSHSDSILWSLHGLAVRVAQKRGYHRNPQIAKLQITPFDTEMRRRSWLFIRSFDLTFSSQHGVPPMVHEEDCDVDIPTNLKDDDFDEECVEIPPKRSSSDPTPMLFYIQKAKLFPTLERISRRALGVRPSTIELVRELSAALEEWHDSIPPCLAYQPIISTPLTDTNYTTIHRILLELTYLSSKGFLHCPFIVSTKGLCREPAKLMDLCRDAALRIIDIQLEIGQGALPGGRLYEDRYMISNLTLNDFLNAAMFIGVDLMQTKDISLDERKSRIDVLGRSHNIWLKKFHESSDAKFACRVLRGILQQVKFSHQILEPLGEQLPIVYDDFGRFEAPGLIGTNGMNGHGGVDQVSQLTMASIPLTSTALVFKAFNEPLVLEKSSPPTSAPAGSALIQVLAAVIRPHYREHFFGRGFLQVPPMSIPGHACIGRVLAVGSDAVSLRPSQLVFAHGFVAARDDPVNTGVLFGLHRANGQGTERAGVLFDHWKGFWQDVNSVPLETCVALDEHRLVDELHYDFDDLMYLDRLSVAYGSISSAKLIAGEIVIVAPATGHYSGAVAEVAAQIGCRVIALTRNASKMKHLTSRHPNITAVELTGDRAADVATIRGLLPFTKAGGADAFIDVSPPQATGSSNHFDVGLEVLRPGARALLTGALQTVNIPYFNLMCRNITIIGKWMFTPQEVDAVARMVEAGVIKLGKDAGHEHVGGGYKFEDWERALVDAEENLEWGRDVMFMP